MILGHEYEKNISFIHEKKIKKEKMWKGTLNGKHTIIVLSSHWFFL